MAKTRPSAARAAKQPAPAFDLHTFLDSAGIARKVTKYAKAAESLLKPSSAARAVASGAPFIERVDLLVKLISHHLGMANADIDRTVQVVDQKLSEKIVPGGSGG